MGLLYLASILRENNIDVQFIDCLNPVHPGLSEEQNVTNPKRKNYGQGQYPKEVIPTPKPLQGIIRNFHRYGITPRLLRQELEQCTTPNLIMVTSMMTYWYPGVFDVIKIAKEIFPGIPVLLGGNYVTLCPEHAMLSGADYILPGEGELQIRFIIQELLQQEIVSNIPVMSDLDSLPYPAFDLLPYMMQLPIMTSRGCPFRCTYCASHILNSSYRRRSPDLVADEITFWHEKFGIKHFSFYDDAFLMNSEEMAIPLLEEIIRRKLPCQFHCPNGLHLRGINEEIGRLMFKAGFRTLRFGFETSDLNQQIKTGGKVTNEHLRTAIFHLKKAGYKTRDIGLYLLCGLPGQSAQEVKESILFVLALEAKPILAEFSPIPGTVLWDQAVKTSYYDIEREPLFHNNTLLPCRNEHFTYEDYRALKSMVRLRTVES